MWVYLGFGGEEGGVSRSEKPEKAELPTSESGVTQKIGGCAEGRDLLKDSIVPRISAP